MIVNVSTLEIYFTYNLTFSANGTLYEIFML